MKKEFTYGLIIGMLIIIILIGFLTYQKQAQIAANPPRLETYKQIACNILWRSKDSCDTSTNSIIVEDFDANKDKKIDSLDTLFELCKNYYDCTDENCCKRLCDCP